MCNGTNIFAAEKIIMILVINSGSSNVKYAVYDIFNLAIIYKGKVETLEQVFSWLELNQNEYPITIVGHRIVHGGLEFFEPLLLTAEVIKKLKKLIPLAPLHQPHNIAAIEFLMRKYPNIKQVGCFDTAFHRTQDKLAKLFAIPNYLANDGVIRYGFHGLSYEYIASVLESKIGPLANRKVIVAHLGNGASMCGMFNGHSIATSMGFSALDGLMMGTRAGSIDPGVLLYLLQEKKYSVEQLSDLLYNKCGLLGVSEISNDIQILMSSSSKSAADAIDLFCYIAATEFGKLLIQLQGCDALIFTGGIGENASLIRNKICTWLGWYGIQIDTSANNDNHTIISADASNVLVAAIPTNEEYIIAMHTKNIFRSLKN